MRVHRPGEIEHELIASLASRPASEMKYPVRMVAVQVAVWIDHLGLNPQAEVHAKRVHPVDQGLQAMRKLDQG